MGKSRQWMPLFSTNFLGVLNNNYLKTLIIFLSISLLRQTNLELIITLASGLYVLPYIFFSPIGGRLAKSHNKSQIMFLSKCWEFIIFIVACFGFIIHNIYIGLFCVFAVGLISTLFSPSKYGLIRDIGGNEGISFGTGLLEMFTFLGVLIGTFVASLVADHYSFILFAGILLGASLLQLWTSFSLRVVKEDHTMEIQHDTLNPYSFFIQSFRWAKTIKNANLIIYGLAIFWMIGNFVLMNLMAHCGKVMHMTKTEIGILMDISGIGIGLGSMLTGFLSNHKVQLKFSPIGGFGMVISLLSLYFFKQSGISFTILIFFVSFFSGMYMVPLSAWVQHSVEGRLQGDMLAYSNFVIFLLILVSAALYSTFVQIFGTNAVWLLLALIILFMQILFFIHEKQMRLLFLRSPK